MKIKITRPEFLAAASLMTSKKATRYYIGGVHIEPAPSGGVLLVATNGPSLVVFHDKEGIADGEYTIPVSHYLFTAATHSSDGPKRDQYLQVEGDLLSLISPKGKELYLERFSAIDGKFVNWRGVVPNLFVDGINQLAFDADLLRKYSKVNQIAYGQKKDPYICMSHGSDEKFSTILVTPVDSKEWFGLSMPVRLEAPEQKIPFEIGEAK